MINLKLKIKKGDNVQVITGADKGKKGQVLELDKKNLKVKIQGIKMQTHFDNKEEGPVLKEGFIHYSNIKLVESKSSKRASK